jgi:hypothetical protein
MFPFIIGTRNAPTQSQKSVAPATANINARLDTDPGMTKRVSASITFVDSGTKQLQAANGTFTPFAVGDEIEVLGTALNNGIYQVVAIDGANHSFLTVQTGLHNEGPITATVRAT